MSSKVLLLVEGQTEVAFVKQVMKPAMPGLSLVPIAVTTRITADGSHKGGLVTYASFRRQVLHLLGDSSAAMVTSLIDYQGLRHDFPGQSTPRNRPPGDRANSIEAAMQADVSDPRFRPFVVLHEFEALLFSRPDAIAEVLIPQPSLRQKLAGALNRIGDKYSSPEDINDSPETSPSAWIERECELLLGSTGVFRKPLHGPLIAKEISLPVIRQRCRRFDGWIKSLEVLASSRTLYG